MQTQRHLTLLSLLTTSLFHLWPTPAAAYPFPPRPIPFPPPDEPFPPRPIPYPQPDEPFPPRPIPYPPPDQPIPFPPPDQPVPFPPRDQPIPLESIFFIRKSCKDTLYPQVCYSSLFPYVLAIQQSPVRLVGVAISVCQYSKTKPLKAYISSLSRRGYSKPSVRKALKRCSRALHCSVQELHKALKHMRRLKTGADIALLQLHISDALDHTGECIDALEKTPDCPQKSSVIYWTTKVLKFTNVVSSLATKLRPRQKHLTLA